MSSDDIRRYTTEIVTKYLKNHDIEQHRVSEVITIVHTTLTQLAQRAVAPAPEPSPRIPAVAIRRSVTSEYIICLDCGFRGKIIKRHLRSHGLSPSGYRERWGLAQDYPMIAPGYSVRRSEMAKNIGLGRFGGTRLLSADSQEEDDQ